jgi:ferrous iron transport protein A
MADNRHVLASGSQYLYPLPEGARLRATRKGVAVRLSSFAKGDRGVVRGIDVADHDGGIEAAELERRLLEMGFVEGARVAVLHEGLFGRDPMAIRLDDMRVALRRREAQAILVDAAVE